jgi:hypothetical protein
LKELRETLAWLKFVERMNFSPDRLDAAKREGNELVFDLRDEYPNSDCQNVECPISNIQFRNSLLDIGHFLFPLCSSDAGHEDGNIVGEK